MAGMVMLGLAVQTAEGKHIAKATLQIRAGAKVSRKKLAVFQ